MKTGTSKFVVGAVAVAMTLTSFNIGTAQAAPRTTAPAQVSQDTAATVTDLSAQRRHYRHNRRGANNAAAAAAVIGVFGAIAAASAANRYDRGYYGRPYGYYGAPYGYYAPRYRHHRHYYRHRHWR